MKNNSTPRKTDFVHFVRAALERAQGFLALAETDGDAHAIEKWQRVITSLEAEAARAAPAVLRRAA